MRTKRAFKVKQKAFFNIFKGLWVIENCLSPESAPSNSPPLSFWSLLGKPCTKYIFFSSFFTPLLCLFTKGHSQCKREKRQPNQRYTCTSYLYKWLDILFLPTRSIWCRSWSFFTRTGLGIALLVNFMLNFYNFLSSMITLEIILCESPA